MNLFFILLIRKIFYFLINIKRIKLLKMFWGLFKSKKSTRKNCKKVAKKSMSKKVAKKSMSKKVAKKSMSKKVTKKSMSKKVAKKSMSKKKMSKRHMKVKRGGAVRSGSLVQGSIKP
jgi:hypothetical protein